VLAVDGQLKDMLRQLWVVCWDLDLVLVRKGTLKLWVLGLRVCWTLDAVVDKPVAVGSHGYAEPTCAGLLAVATGPRTSLQPLTMY